MLYSEFSTLVRLYTKTNSSTFTDGEIVSLSNAFLEQFSQRIADEVGEDVFGMEMNTDLVENQREYQLPERFMKLKRLEANMLTAEDVVFNTSNPSNLRSQWEVFKGTDLNNFDVAMTNTLIKQRFSGLFKHFIFRNSIWLLTGYDVQAAVAGLRGWIIVYPQPMVTGDLITNVDMSTSPDATHNGFPRQFHELLARRVAISYKSSADRPKSLNESERKFDQDFMKALDNLRGQDYSMAIQPTIPYNDGTNY